MLPLRRIAGLPVVRRLHRREALAALTHRKQTTATVTGRPWRDSGPCRHLIATAGLVAWGGRRWCRCRCSCGLRCSGTLTCSGFVATAGVDQIALLVALFLEVGLIPATASQTERWGADPPPQLRCVAGRADRWIGIGQLLQTIEAVTAMIALEFVNGHENSGISRQPKVGSRPLSVRSVRFQRATRRMASTSSSASTT
jgi:hypothetical protein